jgi:hypothetical protein
LKSLTVKELIEQLQKFDGEKTVFVDDTMEGDLVGVRGAYGLEANSPYRKHFDGHVYLGMID